MQCEAILEFRKLDIEAAIAAESSTGTWTTVGTDGSNTPGRLYLLRGGSSVGQGALGLLNGG